MASEMCLRSLKRTHAMDLSNYGQRADFEEPCAGQSRPACAIWPHLTAAATLVCGAGCGSR